MHRQNYRETNFLSLLPKNFQKVFDKGTMIC